MNKFEYYILKPITDLRWRGEKVENVAARITGVTKEDWLADRIVVIGEYSKAHLRLADTRLPFKYHEVMYELTQSEFDDIEMEALVKGHWRG